MTKLLSSLCSSDRLYAYLTQCRPDLCIIEGGEEEGEVDEEEYVLIDGERDEDDDEVFQKHRSSGDDWEVSVFLKYDIMHLDVCKRASVLCF